MVVFIFVFVIVFIFYCFICVCIYYLTVVFVLVILLVIIVVIVYLCLFVFHLFVCRQDLNGDLHVSVTMPAIEVGTIGGGTGLPAQSGMLQLMGLKVNKTKKQTNKIENKKMLLTEMCCFSFWMCFISHSLSLGQF